MLQNYLSTCRKSIRQVTIFLALLASTTVHAGAEKYRLVWDTDPAHQAIIGWNQSTGSTSPVFQYRLKGNSSWTIAASTTTDYNNSRHGSASDKAAHLISNFVNLSGLSAGSDYEFQVNDSDGAGTIYWFRTAPDADGDFTFVAGGDSRTNDKPRRDGMKLISKIRPLFVIYDGDFMNDGTHSEWAQWLDEWQTTISTDGRIYPIIPTHGNHENDVTDMIAKIFGIANPDAYYSTGIGGGMMRIYTLNTELEPGVGYGAFSGQSSVKWDAQAAWFINELNNPANEATWELADYHRPMRPHTSAKPEGTGRIAAWAQAMFDHGIDLAVESDTHMVKYTYPLEPSEGVGSFQSFVRNDTDGMMFIGEGSWGAPTRPTDDDKPWTMDSDSFWQFKLIHASPSSLDIRTVFFGSVEDEAKGIVFNPDSVTELTQTQQDADPFAMAAGLQLWQSLAGDVITLRDTGSASRFDAAIDALTLVGAKDSWKYLDDGSDQGVAWQAIAFDDSSWSTGSAQLGYGDGDEATIISFGTDSENKHVTSYFRKSFTIADASQIIKLKLRLLRDDGAVVYINGQEVLRSNMPTATISATTFADNSIGGSAESQYQLYSVLPEYLVTGNNVIAVEIHQATANSSDLSFDLDLTAVASNSIGTVPAQPTDLLASTVATNSIELAWTDNATDEVNYELQQRIGSGEWKIIADKLWTNANTYLVENLLEGQEYSFRVRAYNAVGLSAYSNELVQTTASNPIPVILTDNFGDTCTRFDENFTNFSNISVASTRNWHFYDFSGECFARANGFGGDAPADDWLISKPFQLDFYSDEILTFELAKGFSDSIPGLEVLVSTDYDPALHTDPATATWINAGVTLPTQNDYTFFPKSIDLAALGVDQASKLYVAFHYTSSGTSGGQSAVWELDNFELRGKFSPPQLIAEDFENGLNSITAVDVASAAGWQIETRAGQTGAFMNGFGSDGPSEDWLVSPIFTLAAEDYAVLSFDYYHKYDGPEMEVYASASCSAPVDPSSTAWTQLSVDFSGAADQWNDSGKIDISSYIGSHVCIAFKYQSTGTGPGEGSRWGIDNLVVEKSLGILAVDFSGSNISPAQDEPVSFSSIISGGTELIYQWLFGDGSSSTAASPSHAYTAPGQYTVELNVSDDASGKTGSKTRTNYIVVQSADPIPGKDANAQLRIATFNILFTHDSASGLGQLISDLSNPNFAQAKAVAEIIQRVRPDVLLLNELDYDTAGANGTSEALSLFKTNFLEVSQNGAAPIVYGFDYIAPTNTGIQPEDELADPAVDFDFNNSGGTDDPGDAFGFGFYPGNFGMTVLSKYEIDTAHVRTFRKFLWKDMPGALLPADPNDSDGNGDLTSWFTADELNVFRLSSKSHWDIPVLVNGTVVHVLASHPTPPVFDGVEDRNGTRNHDEIRLWADYVTPGQGGYIYDDNSRIGGIGNAQRFVMLGDQNADPVDGDSTNNAILQVLDNNQFNTSFTPMSVGSGVDSDDITDTADFGLRADYVLPSTYGLNIEMNNCSSNDPKLSCGIFWPNTTDVLYRLVQGNLSSDHRMTWLDLSLDLPANDADGDGVGDDVDNCINTANPYQRDSDNDGYGNYCDGDLNNNGFVNGADFARFRRDLGKTGENLDSDLNGDGVINGGDFSILRQLLRKQPGPSALNP